VNSLSVGLSPGAPSGLDLGGIRAALTGLSIGELLDLQGTLAELVRQRTAPRAGALPTPPPQTRSDDLRGVALPEILLAPRILPSQTRSDDLRGVAVRGEP
jgi:hypothetical protein